MVNLKLYRNYFKQLCTEIRIDKMVMVVQEEHLRKKLAGLTGTILAVVYPSGTGAGEADNISDINTCLLFILENNNKTESDPEKEFNCYLHLQSITEAIKQSIVNDAEYNRLLFRDLDRQSFQIEPEWNIAGSYIGYSLSFCFKNYF